MALCGVLLSFAVSKISATEILAAGRPQILGAGVGLGLSRYQRIYRVAPKFECSSKQDGRILFPRKTVHRFNPRQSDFMLKF